jgi:NADH dehydrogenase (ubiquinone) Fe-S protein 3
MFLKKQNWLLKNYAKSLKVALPLVLKRIFILKQDIKIKTSRKYMPLALYFLKLHSLCKYTQLIDIATEDSPKRKNRFRINYILSSIIYNTKIIVSIITNELTYVPSIIKIFKSAGWLEREVWDMYGIYFTGNSELRRILTDYGFSGHPLRKDFPLTGFTEISYSLSRKKIVIEPVELTQEFRNFWI